MNFSNKLSLIQFTQKIHQSGFSILLIAYKYEYSIFSELLLSFCKCYDLRPHATNIFQDIVNSMGAYLQSLFVASQINMPGGND